MIDRDPAHLHPLVREAVEKTIGACEKAGHSFRLFEGYRSPERQDQLYALGRTVSGRIVTYARGGASMHQYGLAADVVGYVDGQWTWEMPAEAWAHLHAFGKTYGLQPLKFEMPHLQWPWPLAAAQAGHYPDAGDQSWRDAVRPGVRVVAVAAKPEVLSEADRLNQEQLDRARRDGV